MAGTRNFFDIADKFDSFPYYSDDPHSYASFMKNYYYFTIDSYPKPLGYVHFSVIHSVTWPRYWTIDQEPYNGGSQLFGVLSFGVHLIAWTMTSEGKRKYWLQRRSMNKKMHLGKLDTTAGGAHLKSCGIVSYHLDYSFLDNPGSYPHVLHVFEMELPAEITPRPNDGEVSEFVTMTEGEVMKALFEDDFKPIVGIQWVAHFCRHGVLTPENETRLLEINSRTHRNLATFFV
ncbi:uncharacterized protein C8A04DRAFT_29166 [Dichotomopilus funicola]|uniref:Nudix hydrolase domain-containing protein n=1 Tax=Dichotomopilus funicola TaxID=1934379 RepID=A0AAN6V2A2_9PEZI|nr:hypothetical protein C8A04DRAFT_29166 [Dichotomopilus funicola]